jgi:hypothetical protein
MEMIIKTTAFGVRHLHCGVSLRMYLGKALSTCSVQKIFRVLLYTDDGSQEFLRGNVYVH